MSNRIPTDEDFQRVEDAMAVRIRAGEHVREEIHEMVSREAKTAVSAVGERVDDLASRTVAMRSAFGQTQSDLSSTMEGLARLGDVLKNVTSGIETSSLRLAGLEERLAGVRADHEKLVLVADHQAADIGGHTSQIQELRVALESTTRGGQAVGRRLDGLIQETERARNEDKLAVERVRDELGQLVARLSEELRRSTAELGRAIQAVDVSVSAQGEALGERTRTADTEFDRLRLDLDGLRARLGEASASWDKALRSEAIKAKEGDSDIKASIASLGERVEMRVGSAEAALANRAQAHDSLIELANRRAQVRDGVILAVALVALALALVPWLT